MKIVYKKRFVKDFKKLPPKVQNQFDDRLHLFSENKFDKVLNNHSVDPTFPNCRSLNISGDYRAIFSEHGDTVIFITIGTHSELY